MFEILRAGAVFLEGENRFLRDMGLVQRLALPDFGFKQEAVVGFQLFEHPVVGNTLSGIKLKMHGIVSIPKDFDLQHTILFNFHVAVRALLKA